MKKYIVELIVFVSGGVVMVLELVGSRVVAPYIGTSLYVWTALIGVILGALSLGYAWGGRLADKEASHKTFSKILLCASFAIYFVAITDSFVLTLVQAMPVDLRFRAAIAALVLLGPASVFLGMVSPYAVRLKMRDVATSGRTVGNLYAISTVGSIAGTFLAGFILIAFLGTTKILFSLAAITLLLAILAEVRSFSVLKVFMLVLIIVGFWKATAFTALVHGQNFVDSDSRYNRIWIYDEPDRRSGRSIRTLLAGGEHDSAMFLDDADDLVFEYTKMYRLVRHFMPDARVALMIGGGAYSYPRDFLRQFPKAEIDVVEIDPKVTELAREYFRLEDSARMKIYHEDGRMFLNEATQKYDVIFGDAFSSYSIPHHLTTNEAIARMNDILESNGAVIINIISSIEGEAGKFLRAEYRTFKEFFPQVYVFTVSSNDAYGTQNIMLVALKSDKTASFKNKNPELQDYLSRRWTKEISADMPVLTDDYAPVEQYVLPVSVRF